MTNYWILVSAKNQVNNHIAGGFAQANHGKSNPLRRMKVGDGVLYYSPKLDETGKVTCQRFTAIGCVIGDQIYRHDAGNNFLPHRRNVQYLSAREAPIAPLISRLTFIKDKDFWGTVFRFSSLHISGEDFKLIANAMYVKENHSS